MKYEIKTPEGWSDFAGIKKSISTETIKLYTVSGKAIQCTRDHLLKQVHGFVPADILNVGDTILTVDGFESISHIIDHQDDVSVYDALEVEMNHEYLTSDIVSHNCQFLGSSGTLIDGGKLQDLVSLNPIAETGGTLRVYQNRKEDHTYVCVVDVSRGKGLDYHAFQVIDVTQMPYRLVASFRDNMATPIDYADYIYRTTKNYNDAYTLVEINDIGAQVADILHYEYETEALLHTESNGRNGKRISGGFGKKSDKGIRTTKSVKAVGCNMLKMMIEQDQLIVNDFLTINELSTFSRKGVSYEAESGCHDDLVMPLVLFGWLTDQSFFKEITDIDTMNKLKQMNDEQVDQNMLPLGFSVNNEFDEHVPDDVGGTWFNY